MVKYCVANECPIDEYACASAAENGHLEVLKYLREEVKAPWDWRTAAWAAESGHLHILEYLVERKYDQYRRSACANAAENGHLDCLKYLHETAKAPWDSAAVREARTEQTHRMCTIPPRQRLPITRWLAIRTWRATHDLKSQVSFINKKRIRERRNSFRFRTREIREYTQRDI